MSRTTPKLSLYHTEILRKVMLFDEHLTEPTLVLRGNKALRPQNKVRFSRALLDEAIYEMLEDMEIEGNCIDGWRKIGMDVETAKEDYRGIPSVHVVEGGGSGGIDQVLRAVMCS